MSLSSPPTAPRPLPPLGTTAEGGKRNGLHSGHSAEQQNHKRKELSSTRQSQLQVEEDTSCVSAQVTGLVEPTVKTFHGGDTWKLPCSDLRSFCFPILRLSRVFREPGQLQGHGAGCIPKRCTSSGSPPRPQPLGRGRQRRQHCRARRAFQSDPFTTWKAPSPTPSHVLEGPNALGRDWDGCGRDGSTRKVSPCPLLVPTERAAPVATMNVL